jgi:hypothetical protein
MKPKTSTTQKPSAAQRQSDRWLDWEDAVNDGCQNLATLAQLLVNSGDKGDAIEAELIGSTGYLIKEEVARLKERVQARPRRKEAR